MIARPAARIRLVDVYRAVEDTELFALHRTPPCENCLVGGNVLEAMRPALDRARVAMEEELSKASIADVAAEIARVGRFTLPLPW